MKTLAELTLQEREAIIQRFHARVDRAIAASPPTKTWVRRALRRGGAGRCPVRLKRLSLDVILRHGDALADLFCQYPDDAVGVPAYEMNIGHQPGDGPARINPIQVLTEGACWLDEWGTGWSHAVGGIGAITISHPLHDWSQLDAYLAGRMPDPLAPGRMDGARPALLMHGQTRYFAGMTHLALFERLHCLRGMQNTFQDFHLYPAEVDRLLGALTDYLLEIIRQWGQLDGVRLVPHRRLGHAGRADDLAAHVAEILRGPLSSHLRRGAPVGPGRDLPQLRQRDRHHRRPD